MRVFSFLILLIMSSGSACADAPLLFAPHMVSGGFLQAPRLLGMPTPSPGLQCRQAVRDAGRAAGIPDHLMSAIARVESGRADAQGMIHPWPWSINVEGTDHVYETKADVIAAVRDFQARGVRSIDVGCMQVNLMYHPDAFPTLEVAFDPVANATYAAGFLQRLFAQTGSWQAATAGYHSMAPELGVPYQRKVQSVFAEEQRRDDASGPAGPMRGGAMTALNTLPAGAGAIMLGNHAQSAKLLPMVAGSPQRGLDAYRAAPVSISTHLPLIPHPVAPLVR